MLKIEEFIMNRIIKSMIIIGLLMIISCAPKKTNITIVTEDYPPLSYIENNQLSGYGTEVLQELLDRTKINSTSQLLTWNEAYKMALSKENIVIYTIEKTKERENLFYWIGPIGSNISSVYIKSNSNLVINSLEDLKAIKSLTTTNNWFSEQYLIKQGFTNLNSLPKPEDNLKLLMNNKTQATVLTDLTFPQIAKSAGYKTSDFKPIYQLMETQFYIGISKKSSKSLVKKFENAFKSIQTDSTLVQLQTKWKIKP